MKYKIGLIINVNVCFTKYLISNCFEYLDPNMYNQEKLTK